MSLGVLKHELWRYDFLALLCLPSQWLITSPNRLLCVHLAYLGARPRASHLQVRFIIALSLSPICPLQDKPHLVRCRVTRSPHPTSNGSVSGQSFACLQQGRGSQKLGTSSSIIPVNWWWHGDMASALSATLTGAASGSSQHGCAATSHTHLFLLQAGHRGATTAWIPGHVW